MAKIRKALRLSPRQWRAFLQAWFLLLWVDLRLRVGPFPRLQAWAAAVQSGSSPANALEAIRWQRLWVERAARNHLYPMTCLRRALALQRLLGQQGVAVELRFGARKEEGGLQAHAWIEYQGQPVGELLGRLDSYPPLLSHKVVQ